MGVAYRSSCETDSSHQVLKASVRAQGIEPRLHAQVLQLNIVRSIRVLERCERLLPLAQRGQQDRQLAS